MNSIAEMYLSKDKNLKQLIIRFGPCKISKRGSKYYFEDLVSSIVGQQLSGKAAKTIFTRVKTLLTKGKIITPDAVLKTKDDKLRECGMSWSKVSYIKDLAKKVKEGEVDIKNLNKLSDNKIIDELTKVKGIGRWTAEMFLMFTLARADIFPLDDLGIRKGMEKLFKKELSKQKMSKLAEKWKPFRTTASWYIWRVLDG
jgi:DNA-3-methyladenine glycosylase II